MYFTGQPYEICIFQHIETTCRNIKTLDIKQNYKMQPLFYHTHLDSCLMVTTRAVCIALLASFSVIVLKNGCRCSSYQKTTMKEPLHLVNIMHVRMFICDV